MRDFYEELASELLHAAKYGAEDFRDFYEESASELVSLANLSR